MQLARRYYTDNRRETRTFRDIVAQIVFHHAPSDVEPGPRLNTFVCPTCRHAKSLCTCEVK
jgi:hypothetical protein